MNIEDREVTVRALEKALQKAEAEILDLQRTLAMILWEWGSVSISRRTQAVLPSTATIMCIDHPEGDIELWMKTKP